MGSMHKTMILFKVFFIFTILFSFTFSKNYLVELADKSKAKHAKEVKHVATEHIHKKGDDYFLHFPKPTPKPKSDANSRMMPDFNEWDYHQLQQQHGWPFGK